MIYLLAGIIIFLYWLYQTLPQFLRTRRTLEQEIGALKTQLVLSQAANTEKLTLILDQQGKFDKLQHQKKSSEVRVGQTVEQLTGFLEDFPYPDDEIKAMYQPIDLIVFRDDEIVFVEIKSGEAQLSDKQRRIRDMIKLNKVRFEVHRINGKGFTVK